MWVEYMRTLTDLWSNWRSFGRVISSPDVLLVSIGAAPSLSLKPRDSDPACVVRENLASQRRTVEFLPHVCGSEGRHYCHSFPDSGNQTDPPRVLNSVTPSTLMP